MVNHNASYHLVKFMSLQKMSSTSKYAKLPKVKMRNNFYKTCHNKLFTIIDLYVLILLPCVVITCLLGHRLSYISMLMVPVG